MHRLKTTVMKMIVQRIINYEEQFFIDVQNKNNFYSSQNVWTDSTISPCNDILTFFLSPTPSQYPVVNKSK